MQLNSYYMDHPCPVCRKPVYKLLAYGVHIEREEGKVVNVTASQLTKDQMDRLQELEYPGCLCLGA